jgi:hypothetical protein
LLCKWDRGILPLNSKKTLLSGCWPSTWHKLEPNYIRKSDQESMRFKV